jgi:hypothetical protein
VGKTLLDLAKRMDRLPDQIEQAASNVVVKVVKAIDRDVVPHTPVDTTEALSNWQAELNRPASVGLPAIFPGQAGSTAPQSQEAAIAHVDRALKAKKPGEPVFLSNLADHIVLLNNGSSSQEPKGFVERAALIGRLTARKTKLDL